MEGVGGFDLEGVWGFDLEGVWGFDQGAKVHARMHHDRPQVADRAGSEVLLLLLLLLLQLPSLTPHPPLQILQTSRQYSTPNFITDFSH